MNKLGKATARGALRIAAALLLVDGRYLTSDELGRLALPWGSSAETAWAHWVPALRRAGLAVEHRRGYGYRLAAIPPDALLDDVLVLARELRREQPTRLWATFGRTDRIDSVREAA